MCLKYQNKAPRIKVGWKVFKRFSDGSLRSEMKGRSRDLPVSKWLNEKDYRDSDYKRRKYIRDDEGKKYPMGWHIFDTREAAVSWGCSSFQSLRKVDVFMVLAHGVQGSAERPITVARFIRIH